jgi:hypothetical protein
MLKHEWGEPEEFIEFNDCTDVRWSRTFKCDHTRREINPNVPSDEKTVKAQQILRNYLDRVSDYRESRFSTHRDKRESTDNLSYEARCLQLNTQEISAIALVRDYCDGIIPIAPECFRGEKVSPQDYIAEVEGRIAELDKEFRESS